MTHRDPGLQPERTALARQRTILSVALGSLILALGQIRHGQPLLAIAAALLAVAAVSPGALRPRRSSEDALTHSRQRVSWSKLLRTAIAVMLLALLGTLSSVWNLFSG